jgi:hypothetical protein
MKVGKESKLKVCLVQMKLACCCGLVNESTESIIAGDVKRIFGSFFANWRLA